MKMFIFLPKNFFYSLFIIIINIISLYSFADDTPKYDQRLLQKLGIPVSVVKEIEMNSIPSGDYLVDVFLNGHKKNKQWITIANGEILKDKIFFDTLLPKMSFTETDLSEIDFIYMHDDGELKINIPRELLNDKKIKKVNKDLFTIINYDASTFKNKNDLSSTYLLGEVDINYYGWSLINDLSYSSNEQDDTFSHNRSYIKREFNDGTELQLGEFHVKNSFFSGVELIGLQYSPSNDFISLAISQTIIGYVDIPSTIEIYQNGRIIYSKNVPVGEYQIEDAPVDASSRFVVVKVIGSDGRVTEKPYSLKLRNRLASRSWYSAALGYSEIKDELVGTSSYDFKMKDSHYRIGGLFSNNYANLSVGYDHQFNTKLNFKTSIYSAFSYNAIKHNNGANITFQLNGSYQHNNFSLSQIYYTKDYNDFLYDANQNSAITDIKLKSSSTISLSRSLFKKFNISVGYSRDEFYSSDSISRVIASIHHQSHFFNTALFYQSSNNDNSVSFNISIPLGKRGGLLTSSYTNTKYKHVYNTHYSQPITDNTNISIGSDISSFKQLENEDSKKANTQSYYFRGGYRGNITTASVGINYSNNRVQEDISYNGSLHGGVVLTKYGIDLSPDNITNTFALVKFSDDVDDVAISSTSGLASPTIFGRAVIPSLKPYQDNSLVVDTKNLPDDIYSVGGIKKIKPDYGSVNLVKFDFIKNKFAMFNLYFNNSTINSGWYVVNQAGEYVTVIGEDGIVGIEEQNLEPGNYQKSYIVTNGNTQLCSFDVDYSNLKNNNIYSIKCRP